MQLVVNIPTLIENSGATLFGLENLINKSLVPLLRTTLWPSQNFTILLFFYYSKLHYSLMFSQNTLAVLTKMTDVPKG